MLRRSFIQLEAGGPYRIFGPPNIPEISFAASFLRHRGQHFNEYKALAGLNIVMMSWLGVNRPLGQPMGVSCPTDALTLVFPGRDLVRFELDSNPNGRPASVNPATHPKLFAAEVVLETYARWWLFSTGQLYRFGNNKANQSAIEILQFYLGLTFVPSRVMQPLVDKVAEKVNGALMDEGLVSELGPAVEAHLERLCNGMEDALGALNENCPPPDGDASSIDVPEGYRFLLGTPHVTVADLVLASTFNTMLLADEVPGATLSEAFPELLRYCNFVERGVIAEEQARSSYPDQVPEETEAVLRVVNEVFSFLGPLCEATVEIYNRLKDDPVASRQVEVDGNRGFAVVARDYSRPERWEMGFGNYVVTCCTHLDRAALAQEAAYDIREAFRHQRDLTKKSSTAPVEGESGPLGSDGVSGELRTALEVLSECEMPQFEIYPLMTDREVLFVPREEGGTPGRPPIVPTSA